ncbi:hypothetical protein KS4_35510 [Poriferisphaera corsica]|uniref:Uncharacterized protein n=1 Tax=Poriferisphaera corsica TaxID=2528020 RepID=A0A517YZ17_9BACT|nr:hypothetical protein KS4_35510 [Poriferisphaera corsica]
MLVLEREINMALPAKYESDIKMGKLEDVTGVDLGDGRG